MIADAAGDVASEQSASAFNEADHNIIFKPNPGPQTDFLSASEKEVLYGGAAGGGKSYAMLADPLRYMTHPQFSGLLLRHTTEELRELIWKSQEMYPKILPGIKWSERKMQWEHPSGAKLWMSYLDRDEDVLRYQGLSFCWIGFDELTQWGTPFAWNYMRSRLRSTARDLPVCMRASTNPGNKGHCLPFGEVLTASGWVDIKEVKAGDIVLTMKKDGTIKNTVVSDTVKENYSGLLINRKDQMVFTENHRIPYVTSEGFTVKPFYDLSGQVNVVRAGNEWDVNGTEEEVFVLDKIAGRKTKLEQPMSLSMDNYAKLMGWFLSEGYTLDRDKEFGIAQIKLPQRDTIEKLLKECGFKYRKHTTGFSVSCPTWYAYLKQFGKCRDKFIPRNLLNHKASLHTLETMMAGDGHWRVLSKSGVYYTISKQLSDDFCELAVKAGFSVWVSSRQRDNREGLCYEVSIRNVKSTEVNTGNHIYDVDTENKKTNITKTNFSGEVYCITVPETEVFFVRQNGYVWLSGNSWVKKMFIDPAPAGKAFNATNIETNEVMVYPKGHSKEGKPLFKRRFVPALLRDNPHLAETGDYETMLLSLPEAQRKQLLEGSWDVAEGAAFSEFNRTIHVVEPFNIPSNWTKYRACDYGYGSFSAVLWFAVAPDESIYVYRELYVTKVLAEDLAAMVLEMEAGESIRYGVLDSSTWHKRGDLGPSIAERMIAKNCRWRPADRSSGSRVAGKNEVHRRLQIDPFTEEPRMKIFNTCTQLIADLPTLPIDKANPEDIDTKVKNDHTYDALRYGLMSRPRSSLFDYDPNTHKSGITISDKTFGY